MMPGGKNCCFKENDKRYVFYDKEEFYNTIKRFFFLSQSASLQALAAYLDIPFNDMILEIKRTSIPVDWVLRMGFKLYEMIETIHSETLKTTIQRSVGFTKRYECFVRQLHPGDKKKLTESMEKVVLFDNPFVIDKATKLYMDNLNSLVHPLTRDN